MKVTRFEDRDPEETCIAHVFNGNREAVSGDLADTQAVHNEAGASIILLPKVNFWLLVSSSTVKSTLRCLSAVSAAASSIKTRQALSLADQYLTPLVADIAAKRAARAPDELLVRNVPATAIQVAAGRSGGDWCMQAVSSRMAIHHRSRPRSLGVLYHSRRVDMGQRRRAPLEAPWRTPPMRMQRATRQCSMQSKAFEVEAFANSLPLTQRRSA